MSFGTPLTAQWLTPFKHTCLLALAEGPLDRKPEGWVPRQGGDGCWNNHVVTYLAFLGFARLNHGKTTAGITNPGRKKLGLAVDYAA
jgi:hypothetical protein